MQRPPRQPRREELDEADREAHDAVIARLSSMSNSNETPANGHVDVGQYWGAMLNSPQLCALAAQLGTFVRTAGERGDSYSHAEREFVDQVLCADWKTNTVLPMHIPDGLAAGVRMEAIEALRHGHEDDLNDHERLLARYIRQVVSGTVDDQTWSALEAHFGTRGILDYTAFILWLQWILRMMQALGVNEPDDAEIDQLISDLKDGTRPIPDFRQRIR